MANFTLKNATSNLNWLVKNKAEAQSLTRDTATYSRNSTPFISVNYPEEIKVLTGNTAATAESGRCVFQKKVPAGDTNVFYSHSNYTGSFKFGIQIYNTGANPITVKKLKYGNVLGWNSYDAAKTFLDDSAITQQTISGYGNWWIKEHDIPSSSFLPFCGHLLFNSTGEVIVTIYIFQKKTNISGNESIFVYPTNGWNKDKYSGAGIGDVLSKTVNLTIDSSSVSGMSNLGKNNYWFMTGEPNNPDAGADITPLTLQDGSVARYNAASPRNNLGNWGTRYVYTINIQNKTSAAKTLYGFVSSYNARVAIKSANTVGKNLETNTTWRFMEETIPAGSSKTLNYTYMLASYGCGAVSHMFSLKPDGSSPV